MKGLNEKIFPGTIYFKYLPGDTEPTLIRLIRIKNSDCFIVESKGSRVKMSGVEFKTYTKLNPDAYIIFAIVELDGGVRDVIISEYRKQDLDDPSGLPYCVCRMSIYDMFTNTISPSPDGRFYIGCSVSRDTCPVDVDFKMMVACNSVIKSDAIGVYYDDNYNTMSKFINLAEYDQVISILDEGYDHEKVITKCKTVKELLEQSHFMQDYWKGFNLVKAPWKWVPEVANILLKWVEDIIKHEMLGPVVVKFTRDIDLNKIQDDWILLLDESNDIYIISYKEGEYVNRPYEELGDHTEVETLEKMAGKRYDQFHIVK